MKSRRIALVSTVPTRACLASKFGNLAARLGPVCGKSYRQSSRIANKLRAGYPVKQFADLASAGVFLLCVPNEQLNDTLAGLRAVPADWRGKIVLLCSGIPDSAALQELADRGAATGSLVLANELGGTRFLVEGDRLAIREAKKLVESGGGRVVVVRRSSQALCAAAGALSSWMLMPLLDASALCLREAGLPPGRAGPFIEGLVVKSLRAYRKGGRRAWKHPTSVAEQHAFLAQLRAVNKTDPELAEFLLETARLAVRRMGQDTGWLEGFSFPLRYAAAGAEP